MSPHGSQIGLQTNTVLISLLTSERADLPLATVRVFLVVAALWKIKRKLAESLFVIITVGDIEDLRDAVLVVRTEQVFWLTGRGGAVPVPPAVVFVWEPAGPRHSTVDVLLRGTAVRGGGGGGGVLTVSIAVVTLWPAGAVREVVVVTAVVGEVEHLGVSLLVIGTEVVGGVQAWLTVPVPPAVVRVGVVASSYSLAVNSLLRRGAVRLGGCGGDRVGAVNIPVRTGPVPAVHVSRVHTEPVENVILEVVRACLVGDAATLALVELVAQLGVGLLDKVIRATDRAVREGVVTLARPTWREDQWDRLGLGPVTHLLAADQPRQRDNPNTKNCQVNIPSLDLLIYFASS